MNKYGDFSKGQFWNDLANSTGNHDRDTTTQKVQGRSFTSIHADSPIVHDNPEPLDPSETKTANVTLRMPTNQRIKPFNRTSNI